MSNTLKNKQISIGYPRSGNHWIVHCINHALNIPIGFTHANSKVLYEHIQSKINLNLVLIIRNYKESVIRHVSSSDSTNLKLDKILFELRGIFDYVSILKLFDDCKNNKIVVYYEDLITNPKKELYRLSNFFKLKDHNIENFMNNFKKNKQESLDYTTKRSQKGETSGNHLIYHSNKISKNQRIKIDEHLIKSFPELYNKYLKRYGEDCLS